MLYGLLVAGYVLVCFTLLISVLLQQGKGGNMAAAFGGGGGQAAFGARQGATVLSKASAVLGALFMVGALGLAIIGQQGPGTVMRGTPPPASQPPPPGEQPLPDEPLLTLPQEVQPAEPQPDAPK
jgi:preprotein translocase subunit SecG